MGILLTGGLPGGTAAPVLSGTVAPLIYAAAATCVLLGIGFTNRVSSGGSGRNLLGVGFLLAIVARVLEVDLDSATLGLALLVGGTVVGVLLGSQANAKAAPSTFAWIAGAGGASALATSIALLASAPEGAVAVVGAYVGAGFGALAVLQGLLLAVGGSESAQASARAAVTVACAGLAMGGVGFAIENVILLVVGGTTACSGVGLGRVMGRASSRTFSDLAFGDASVVVDGYRNVRSCGADEAAMVIETARNILIVPGFGTAVAQAQHALKQLVDTLEKHGATVRYAVHPSAGCVPGQLNGVLDEANVPHTAIAELEEANELAAKADVVLCIGANDVINPSTDDKSSPVYGMAGLDLSKARAVFVVKRSLNAGASGAKNPLFEAPQTTMVFGDAKRVTQQLVTVLSSGH